MKSPNSLRGFLAMTLATLLAAQTAFAAGAPVELRWNELSSVATGKTVEIVLPGAVTVKGDVAAIREDGLVLDVHQTSDSKAQPKGNALIPRASVTVLRVEEHGTNWRTMGTVLGAIGGIPLGGYIAAKRQTPVVRQRRSSSALLPP